MLTILVIEIKEGKNAQKKQKIKPKLTFRLSICYSSLVCLYKFRKKGLFLGGGGGQNVISWGGGHKEGWGNSPPPPACTL